MTSRALKIIQRFTSSTRPTNKFSKISCIFHIFKSVMTAHTSPIYIFFWGGTQRCSNYGCVHIQGLHQGRAKTSLLDGFFVHYEDRKLTVIKLDVSAPRFIHILNSKYFLLPRNNDNAQHQQANKEHRHWAWFIICLWLLKRAQSAQLHKIRLQLIYHPCAGKTIYI